MNNSIIVTRFSKKEVDDTTKIRFNVNNLWASNNEPEPDDYYEALEKTQTKNWYNVVKLEEVTIIEFDKTDTEWMLEALNSYAIMVMMGTDELQAASTISQLFKSQLENTINKHKNDFPNGSFFVRVERVSLKSGIHGVGPYNSLKNIIRSIITSTVGHECISINDDLERFKIYLFNWNEIKEEFRVFVHNNSITAISTQHYSQVSNILKNMNDDDIKINIVNKIVDWFNNNIKDKLSQIVGPNYTMDVALLNDNSLYFIEPNCFGANYAAGSALFHWSIDHEILCNNMNQIEFRFVNKE